MGLPYVNALLEIGIPKQKVIAIEPHEGRRQEVEALGVVTLPTIAEAAQQAPTTAIVAVPSPLHRKVLEDLVAIGVKNSFTEKPLVLHTGELEGIEKLERSIYVGYLINFSPAMDQLWAFMKERDLECGQTLAMWGKNWCAVDRPIGPDLEEELVHPLLASLRLIGYEQVTDIQRQVIGTWVPYVQPEIATQGVQEQFGYSQKPNDTSVANFNVRVNNGRLVPISILSSFNFFEQRRTIDVTLMHKGNAFPDFKACLEFDAGSGATRVDRIRIIDARTDKVVLENEMSSNKLLLQLRAALDMFAGGNSDPRLVGLKEASDIVRLLDGALDK